MVKNFLKKVIPTPIRQKIRKTEARIFCPDRQYRHLSTECVFEEIYRNGIWGRDDQGFPISGLGSHTARIVEPYVKAVAKIVNDHSLKTGVDLGCGDFAVGSRIYGLFEQFTACDISKTILDINRETYRDPSLDFRKLDLTTDDLPQADIAFLRQVLQHLSNNNIDAFVKKVNNDNKFKFLLVTEHIPAATNFSPNIDKPNEPGIRTILDSGIVLHEASFNLIYKKSQEILSIDDGASGKQRFLIKSTLYEF